MANLELFEEMLNKFVLALKYHNLVNSLNTHSYKRYPNLEVDFDVENKKIADSGLVLTNCDRFIYLNPKHNSNSLKALFESSDDYELDSYNLMENYKFMFRDSINKGELNDLDIKAKYRKFDSLIYSNFNGDAETALEEMAMHIDRLILEFKEDYDTLLNGTEIFKAYKELFNKPKPTGDFKKLVKLLKENNVDIENLNKLEIVDGKVIKFDSLKLTKGRIVFTGRNAFEYDIAGNGNYEDDGSFVGNPNEYIDDLEYAINELMEIKEEAVLAKNIIEVLNKIENVNYYKK